MQYVFSCESLENVVTFEMNCCNMFFMIENWMSLNMLKVWLPEEFDVVWARPEAFNFWVSFLDFASRNSKRRLKIESLRCCSNFGYQNSLMLCLCVRLLVKIRDVQFLRFIFRFCFKKFKKKIENWISQMLLKLWLPE